MFLHFLDADQQQRFFEAANYIAAIDGVDDREEALLEAARIETGRDALPPAPSRPEEVLRDLRSVASPVARNVFLLELTGFVVAGGDSRGRERELAFLDDCGEALGASEEQLATFKDFARRSFEVYRVGLDLIAESSGTDEGA